MNIYPDGIYTGREIANLPGIEYKEDDKTTIFAEDIGGLNAEVHAIESTLGLNPQGEFPTVADRLAAGGGGGGAWELIYDETVNAGEIALEATGLDLQADGIYEVYFSAFSANETTFFEYKGEYGIFPSWQGSRIEGGSWTYQTAPPWISHPSLGPGTGKLTLSTMYNGTMAAELQYGVANQRAYQFTGCDGNWYSGGINLTSLKLRTQTDWNLENGTYMRIFRRVV